MAFFEKNMQLFIEENLSQKSKTNRVLFASRTKVSTGAGLTSGKKK
jgi:hypothetical protein